MRVLVIGSGGREHALVWALKRSNRVSHIVCAPGNGGIARDATCYAVSPSDHAAVLELAISQKIDLGCSTARPASARRLRLGLVAGQMRDLYRALRRERFASPSTSRATSAAASSRG
jgi:phosphoribosylamine-glycine ligase